MFMRIFRALVCFLLICCLVINISPIRAEATGAEAIFLSSVVVNPTIAVTAVLFGLGVMVTAAATAVFTKLVDDITADMVDKGLISSSGVDMYRSDADGAATYMVNQELVEAVRDYLWENEVLTEDGTVPDGWVSYGGYAFPAFDTSYPYVFVGIRNNELILHVSQFLPYAFHFTPSVAGGVGVPNEYYTIGTKVSSYSTYTVYNIVDSGWAGLYTERIHSGIASGGWSFDAFIWSNCDICYKDDGSLILAGSSVEELGSGCIAVADGLAAGIIAGQDQTFAEGYSEWASGARTLPTLRDGVQTDAMSAYIALGMGLTQEETMAMTQAAVQSGVGTYEGTGSAADSVTASGLKGWLDTIRLSMVAGFSDVIAGITGFFTPSGNVDSYAIDLTSFFPFCIPFDLYDFLSLFLAEPEAPHFEFDIDFPYMNEPWHLVIDLSPWDGVAQLLRRLELLLFIVGLGMVTREKFLRG